MDATWPAGWRTQLRLDGRARDVVTIRSGDAPVIVGDATVTIGVGDNRSIEDIASDPDTDGLQELVGQRGGGYLRAALAQHLPQELKAGTPLYLLLDDISGSTLVAGFAWSQWSDDWLRTSGKEEPPSSAARVRRSMEGICIGFAPGSSALVEAQRDHGTTHRIQVVPSLVNPQDPHGWHALTELPGVSFRRARRIDVWRDPVDGKIMIDSGFQDSAGNPDHGRIAVHEYMVRATADPETLMVTSVDPDPRILPFRSCPAAAKKASAIVGTPLADLRTTVLERLARTEGCTHLNDALRALAEVPVLLTQLDHELTASHH